MNQSKNKVKWVNESGQEIPYNYITPSDKVKERVTNTILTRALSIHDRLSAFKAEVEKQCNLVIDKKLEELNARGKSIGKGGTIFYNFDRSVKIEISIAERIDFDDVTIQACKSKLDEFLNENLDAKTEFLKEMVTDAFSTSRGKLDSKKLLALMRYRSKIKDVLFQEALDLLSDSIRRPGSKTYFRVWERDRNGQYRLIDLNFSSI